MNLNDMLQKTYGKKSSQQPVADDNKPEVRKAEWAPLNVTPSDVKKNVSKPVFPQLHRDEVANGEQGGAAEQNAGFIKQIVPPQTDNSKNTVTHSVPGTSARTEVPGNVASYSAPTRGAAIEKGGAAIEKGGSTYNRVAKFLMLIGIDEAAKILSKLPSDQCEKIALELAYLHEIPAAEAAAVLEEFGALAERASRNPLGGVETARSILDKAFGSEQGEKLLHKAVPDADGTLFDFVTELDSEKLVFLLNGESPAVQAIVLSHVAPPLAAKYINGLESDVRNAVILRLGKMKKIERDVVERIDHVMREKATGYVADRPDVIDGRSVLARILNSSSYDKSLEILDNIQNSDSALAADIQNRMFNCERVTGCYGRGFEELVAKMPDGDLALLIHDKTAEFRQTIFDAVSENRRHDILSMEEILQNRPSSFERSGEVTAQFLRSVRNGLADGTVFDKDTKIIRS